MTDAILTAAIIAAGWLVLSAMFGVNTATFVMGGVLALGRAL